MHPRRHSIAFYITTSVLAASTAMVALFGAVLVWRAYADARSELAGQVRRITSQLAIGLEIPAWNFDRAQVDGLIESAMQARDIAAVVVELDGTRPTVYARHRDREWRIVRGEDAQADAGSTLAYRLPIRPVADDHGRRPGGAADRIGTVTVRGTDRWVRAQFRGYLLYAGAAVLVGDAALALVLYLLLRRTVLVPLRAVRAHAAAVAEGADEVAGLATSRFPGEFEQLRESLATMLALLQSRYRAVQFERRRYHELLGQTLRLQDAERRHIGRELHDSTGQVLAALEINLSLLQRRGAALAPDLKRLLDESAELARQCRATIRTTSYLLHPPLLEELGLAMALRWLADGFRERSAISLDVQVPVQFERLPPDVELALFRVAQEALTNVQRHASGGSASLSLERHGDAVRLSIADSGAGMVSAEGSYGIAGVGLASMRERMAEMGGELQIESDESGTCITAVLPLSVVQRNTN